MKTCSSCYQVYPNDGPDFCTNDGTPLTVSRSEREPGSGYGWQGTSSQPPRTPGWQPPPPGWGQPPGQHSPYGYHMPYQPASGGQGLATGALFTGIGTIVCLVLGVVLMVSAGSSYPPDVGLAQIGAIIVFLSVISGLTALILGIVSVSMSNRNPAISKAKGIVGLALGAIPLLLMIIGLIARAR